MPVPFDPTHAVPPADRRDAPRFRWVVCGLLFLATTINYVDRQVIGILGPTLTRQFRWSEQQYGNVITAFQVAYALGFLLSGPVIDAVGVKVGYAASLLVWSLAAMGHGLVRTVGGFGVARFALGIGEAGNFPAAVKAVADWFPARERALATGVFNAGSNFGAIVGPLAVPWITLHYGWPAAFYATGAVGLLWLALWLPVYRSPPPEVAGPPDVAEPAVPWLALFRYRQTWAVAAVKFLPDAVWWFYLFWAPKFLDKAFGASLSKVGLPLIVIYLTADVGSVGGGWLSSRLIRQGWTVNAARKTTFAACAALILPVTFAAAATHLWTAVALISLAAAGHQGWSANAYTLASDLFPRRAVASVVGIASMAGAAGGVLLSQYIGTILQWTGSYGPVFAIAGPGYLVSLLAVHLLSPRMEPSDFGAA